MWGVDVNGQKTKQRDSYQQGKGTAGDHVGRGVGTDGKQPRRRQEAPPEIRAPPEMGRGLESGAARRWWPSMRCGGSLYLTGLGESVGASRPILEGVLVLGSDCRVGLGRGSGKGDGDVAVALSVGQSHCPRLRFTGTSSLVVVRGVEAPAVKGLRRGACEASTRSRSSGGGVRGACGPSGRGGAAKRSRAWGLRVGGVAACVVEGGSSGPLARVGRGPEPGVHSCGPEPGVHSRLSLLILG
jgi:hypothetical protein